jgi:hypothetical protein
LKSEGTVSRITATMLRIIRTVRKTPRALS